MDYVIPAGLGPGAGRLASYCDPGLVLRPAVPPPRALPRSEDDLSQAGSDGEEASDSDATTESLFHDYYHDNMFDVLGEAPQDHGS